MAEQKTCFVIAPIGPAVSDTRKRSDHVFEHIIKDVVESFGYEALRADQISEPGIITNQVIQRTMNATLVIADLTEHNPNVFYELAIRHITTQPLVQLIDAKYRVPFDVHAMRLIQIEQDNPHHVEEAKEELRAYIQSIEEQRADLSNPISIAVPELAELVAERYEVEGKGRTPRRIIVYGDVVTLRHELTGRFLSSDSTNYRHARTSGQQIVIARTDRGSKERWIVKGPYGTPEDYWKARPVRNGDVVRLEHESTSRNLHSHGHPLYLSPITGQQEVTAYQQKQEGDASDNWRIQLDSGKCWRKGARVKLIHNATGRPLHSHEGHILKLDMLEEQEVTCFPGTDDNDYWSAVETGPGMLSDHPQA